MVIADWDKLWVAVQGQFWGKLDGDSWRGALAAGGAEWGDAGGEKWGGGGGDFGGAVVWGAA
jgi:hypothetical protein